MNYFESNPFSVIKASSHQIRQIKTAYAKRITDVEHNLRNLTGLNRFKPYNPSTKEKTDFVFPRTKNLSEEQWIRLIELLCSVHYFACHYYRNSDIYLDQDLIDSLFTAEEQAGCPFKTKDKVTFFGITALCSVFVSKPTILYFLSYIQNIPGFEISPNTNKANLAGLTDKLTSFLPPKYSFKAQANTESLTAVPFLTRALLKFYLQIEKNISFPAIAGSEPSFLEIIKAIPNIDKSKDFFLDFMLLRNLICHGYWPGEEFVFKGNQTTFSRSRIPYVLVEWAEKMATFPGDYYALRQNCNEIINGRISSPRSNLVKKSIQIVNKQLFDSSKLNKRIEENNKIAKNFLSEYPIYDESTYTELGNAALLFDGFRFVFSHNEFADGNGRVVCFKKTSIYHIVSEKNIMVEGTDSGRKELYFLDINPGLTSEVDIDGKLYSSLPYEEEKTRYNFLKLRKIILK